MQFKKFDWKSITTPNFTIYYYSGGNEIAHNAARFVEEDFIRITELTGFVPYKKTTLILYNSINDLQQSNIGLENNIYSGGETSLIKSKIEVAFEGNQIEFREELTYRVAELMINVMLYGGNFKEMVQNSYLMNLPPWFVSGAARFIASGWTAQMTDRVTDVLNKGLNDPTKLTGEDAELVGQSIWNYISTDFGNNAVSSILNYTRIVRSEETSIRSSLGVTYNGFLRNWKKFYQHRMLDGQAPKEVMLKENRVRKFNRQRFDYNNVVANPDTNLFAYTENKEGKYFVYVYSPISGKKRLVYTTGYRLVDQQVDDNLPLIAWRSRVELSVMYYWKGRPYFVTKNIVTGKKEKKLFNTFDAVLSFDYSPVKKEMVFSAVKKGQSDIFIYDYQKNKARRVTRDLYDDLFPTYVAGTNKIIFTSNRLNDTLRVDIGKHETIKGQYNLFSFDLDERNNVLTRLTASLINEVQAYAPNENEIYYLGERNHISHLFRLDLKAKEISQVTDFEKGISSFSFSRDGQHFAYIAKDEEREHLYIEKGRSFAEQKNGYQLFSYGWHYQQILEENPPGEEDLLDQLMNFDVNNQKFESDSAKKLREQMNLLLKGNKRLKIYGPYKYKGLFGADYVVSSLVIDPLRGTGGLFEVGMSEMFGNHRFNATVFALTDLKSSSFQLQYQMLEGLTDYRFKYDKQSIFAFNEVAVQRYSSNVFDIEFARPITPSTRFSVSPGYVTTRYTDFNNITKADVNHNYGTVQLEFVLDNTKKMGMNMVEGTRIKAQLKDFRHLGDRDKNFSKFVFDARQYLRLYQEIILAFRGSYGQFSGPASKSFLLGGMDNWIFNQTDYHGNEDPLDIELLEDNSDVLFVDYVTNLRGFNYNKMYGSKYLLFNAELRVPISKLIYNRPIASSFFRNLQLASFYDIGTSWTGTDPFSQQNSINTQEFNSDPFSGTVVNYQNPFLSSYGFGFRSMLMGYYMKLDMAWGIEDYAVLKPRLHLTFGYDF